MGKKSISFKDIMLRVTPVKIPGYCFYPTHTSFRKRIFISEIISCQLTIKGNRYRDRKNSEGFAMGDAKVVVEFFFLSYIILEILGREFF